MKNSTLSLIALAAVGMTGLSFAGPVGEQPVLPTYGKALPASSVVSPCSYPTTVSSIAPWSLSLSTGYSTNYSSRGLVPHNANTNHVVPVEINAEYALNKSYSLVGKIGYQWMMENGLTHARSSNLSDEGSIFLGGRKDWHNGLKTTLGYQFVNGGLPGAFRVQSDKPHYVDGNRLAFHSAKPEEHNLILNARYDLCEWGLKNWFVESQVQYAFQWNDGWWFENTLGYKYDVCSRCSLVFSGTWNASSGYFDANSWNNNGTQGVSLKVEAPVKVTRQFNVAPFISTIWLGEGGQAANRHTGREIYRNFTVLGGFRLNYTF